MMDYDALNRVLEGCMLIIAAGFIGHLIKRSL